MHYRRFAVLFLSDAAAFAKAREGGKRWIEDEPDCCWAQHWWGLFGAGVDALAPAISADTQQGRHLRTTPPAWLMPYPELVLHIRRAEWRAAKRWLIEQQAGSLRDPFERWQELIEITKAYIPARDEVSFAPELRPHIDVAALGTGNVPTKPA